MPRIAGDPERRSYSCHERTEQDLLSVPAVAEGGDGVKVEDRGD